MIGSLETQSDPLPPSRARCNDVTSETSVLRANACGAEQFEPTKLFVHTDRISRWLAGETIAPVTLELDITLACNDQCPHCPHSFAHQRRYLHLETIRRLLDEAASLGIPGLTITGGGEPLMHPDFANILRVIKDYPFAAGLITNGGKLTADIATELTATFAWIRVSLDAASETTFVQVRGRGGSAVRLERIALLPRARQLAGNRQCEIGASFLTCSQSAQEIARGAKQIRDLGFDYMQFKPMVNWNGRNKHGSPIMNQQGVFEGIEEALTLSDTKFNVLVSRHRYEGGVPGCKRSYAAFHSAWFVVSVGPSMSATSLKPALYLDCSSKYLPEWTVGEFSSLAEVLGSRARQQMILETSSEEYCVPSEKHATYNTLLEAMFQRSRYSELSEGEIRAWSPNNITHPYSL